MSAPDLEQQHLLWGDSAWLQVIPVNDGWTAHPIGHVVRRERALVHARLSGRTRWRLRRPLYLGTLKDRVGQRLSAGAVIVIGDPAPSETWSRLLAAAGIQDCASSPSVGTDGGLRLPARRDDASVMLRVGRTGSPGDPTACAEAMRRVAGLPGVPRCVGTGTTDGWSWVVEEFLPGRRPYGLLSEPQLTASARWLGLFRQGLADQRTGTTTGSRSIEEWLQRQVDAVAQLVPEAGRALEQTRAEVLDAHLPLAPTHGDFWAGNLLFCGDRLSGVVDWDAFSPQGFLGLDLVHLLLTQERLRQDVGFGVLIERRPWREQPMRRRFERMLPIAGWPGEVTPATLDAVAAAWWLQAVAVNLARMPRLRSDAAWCGENVLRPLGVG